MGIFDWLSAALFEAGLEHMALIRSTITLQETIGAHISRGNLDAALRLVHETVDQIFCEPINTARIFGSRLLDKYCQEIGAINLRRIRASLPAEPSTNKTQHTVVFLVSRLYATGGHTAVLSDLIRLGPRARCVILVSGTVGLTDHAALLHRFKGNEEVSLECAPRGTRLEKLDWLQRKLLALSPNTVWLLNHCQDSVAVAAVQPDAGYDLRYYHHGDHQLCLGVYLSYADHIDPHPMGVHNCRDNLGIRDNRYLPLVVQDQGPRQVSMTRSPTSGLTTCTAASPNKIEVPYFIRYADVVPPLIRASGGKHIHIGHLSLLTRWRIRYGIRRLGLPRDSFVHIPYVQSVWRTLHDHRVDLYVASFPYGGARTLIEAMGAGVPVALHLHSHSRLLGTFDMAFNGALLWRSPEELYQLVHQHDAQALEQRGQAARRIYEQNYREQVLESALANWQQPLPLPPLLDGYSPDKLQQALDITNQVSLRSAAGRMFDRAMRRWKSSRA